MLEGFINSFWKNEDEEDYEADYISKRRYEEKEDKVKYEKNVIQLHGGKEVREPDIVITKPRDIVDCKNIIDQLIEGNSVMIDLGQTLESEKQRVMDMVSGYCYAFDCNIERINNTTFVVSHSKIQNESFF